MLFISHIIHNTSHNTNQSHINSEFWAQFTWSRGGLVNDYPRISVEISQQCSRECMRIMYWTTDRLNNRTTNGLCQTLKFNCAKLPTLLSLFRLIAQPSPPIPLHVTHYTDTTLRCVNPLEIPCHCSPDLFKAVSEFQWWTFKPHKPLHTQGKILKNQPVSLTGTSNQEQGAPLNNLLLTRMFQQWQCSGLKQLWIACISATLKAGLASTLQSF